MAEEFFAAEQLVVGVLQPPLAQHVVGQIVHVFEDGEPRHQSRRQWWAARPIRVNGPQPLLQELPIDAAGQLRQRMREIDDLIEPRPEKVLLAALVSLRRSHRCSSR